MRIKRNGAKHSGIPPPRVNPKGGGTSPSSGPGVGVVTGPAQRDDCNSNDASLSDRDSDAHDLDNSDYQWFLDYNIRDNTCHHTSVLSSLSASYKGIGELTSGFDFTSRYDDLARDMDANIAEADMESFRTEDIHHLLMTTANAPHETIAQHNEATRDGDESTVGSINTMSICKSELLFSPVKEAPAGGVHFSIDSLDCELLNEQDLILTCQANKDNYTIAFEGSMTNYSEDSEADAMLQQNDDEHKSTAERLNQNLAMLERCHQLMQNLESSMARSDTGFTTWSKLRKQANQNQLRRHPSGNNNQVSHDISTNITESQSSSAVLKSQSLPDIASNERKTPMNREHNAMTSSDCDSITSQQRTVRSNTGFIRVYDVSQNNSHCTNHSTGSQHSEPMSTSSLDNQTCSDKSQPKQGFSLVKLFMKQKSMSNEGIMSTTMDQSDRSECWPNSSEGDSGDSFAQDNKSKNLKQKAEQYDNVHNRYMNSHTDNAEYILSDSLIGQNEQKTELQFKTDSWTIQEEDLVEKSDCEILNEKNITKEAICDNESNIYATVNKTNHARFNLNNNIENPSNCSSPIRIRGNQGTQTRRSCSSSGTSVTMSSYSESEGTQVTRLHRLLPRDTFDNKSTSTQLNLDLMDKSMQTSAYIPGLSHFHKDKGPVRVVEQSFLEKLKQGNSQKPVYVLYPNYTLPDLSFLSNREPDFEKILLKPQKYVASPSEEDFRSKKKTDLRSKRPFSCNDVETLRKKGFGHIKDWESLTFLLPLECRQILAEMPEIVRHMKDREDELLAHKEKPLFCAAGSNKSRGRPMSCDCTTLNNNTTNISSGSSTATQPSSGYRGSSTMLSDSSAQNSPAPLTNFNPLFVYRYDSTTSSEASVVPAEKQRFRRSGNSADQTKINLNGKMIDVAPPRPPLPKSILRKSMDKLRKNSPNTKRYSMFEMDEAQQEQAACYNVQYEQKNSKRRSLQDPYYLKSNSIELRKNNDLAAKRLSQQFLDAADKDGDDNEYDHDEGVGTESSLDSGKSNDASRPLTPPLPKPRNKQGCSVAAIDLNSDLISSDDLQQLEDFLKHSGISCNNMDEWDDAQMHKVRHQVSRFLSMKRSQDENKRSTDSNSSSGSKKSVSFAESRKEDDLKTVGVVTSPGLLAQRHYQAKNLAEIPICEEGELTPEDYGSPARNKSRNLDISQKRALVLSVADAVELLIQHFSPASDQEQLAKLGDSALNPACAKLALNALCPSLYAIFRDGLRESIDTSFGPINNSVWQMIEVSARQGPITKALHELVQRINGEDAITEGLVKFNAFILGLLNARSVDAWVSYIRTRESILSKHYHKDSLLYAACIGEPSCRALLDSFLASLEPLSLLPFRLDLMFEMKELHRSFKRMESDLQSRSGIRLHHNSLMESSSEYANDRVPHPTPVRQPTPPDKFKRLQLKWEMLSTGDNTPVTSPAQSTRSRIPRPVTSPVGKAESPGKAHRSIPVPVSSSKKATTPPTPTAPSNHRTTLPPARNTAATHSATKKTTALSSRTSRVDQDGPITQRVAQRPSSLPHPPANQQRDATAKRRAASSSTGRHAVSSQVANKKVDSHITKNKMVRTVCHRLSVESGQLEFKEGERLRLLLEVDCYWLLCCRGDQKGLVPRSAVIPENPLIRI